MSKSNIITANAVYPIKVFFDVFQRDALSQDGHLPLVASNKRHHELIANFSTA